MNYPHRIRLHGPWECEPLAGGDSGPAPLRRVTYPIRLHEAGFTDPADRVRLTRRFGYPGRIDTGEHVWLTFSGVVGWADLTLNGQPLGTRLTGSFEFEITALLGPRNRLEVVLDVEPKDAGLLGEIALEIRRDAFLRDVAIRCGPDGTVHLTGLVVGTSTVSLELYGLADRRNVVYSTIEARPEGQAFELSFVPESSPAVVRLELVCVSERWYAVELPMPIP